MKSEEIEMDMEEKESTETSSMNGGNSDGESPPISSGGGNKRKRGRPTKYDENGNLRVQYLPSHANWKFFSSGEVFANTAGSEFVPHVVTIHKGEDVAGKLLSISQEGPQGICILTANGTISNVTIRQTSSSGGLLTYEGRFEILNLTGSFVPSENIGMRSRTGGLSISLAGPDGRVMGGSVSGILLADSPIQVVFGSFKPNCYKVHKRKHQEPRMAPVVNDAPDTVKEAMPLSQAAPATNTTHFYATPVSVYSHGGLNNRILNNMENANLTSTGSADYSNSGSTFDPLHYTDNNVSVSFD